SLNVNGTPVDVAAPNQVIPLGTLGTITINEQIPNEGQLTVYAIHVAAPSLGVDVIVSAAAIGYMVLPPAPCWSVSSCTGGVPGISQLCNEGSPIPQGVLPQAVTGLLCNRD